MNATDRRVKVAELDGEIHTTERECCRILGQTCRRCGGFQHAQPCYGGIVEMCEVCDPSWWVDAPAVDSTA